MDRGAWQVAVQGLQRVRHNWVIKHTHTYTLLRACFPGGSDDKDSTCQCRRHEFSPWVGKIPWWRQWQPTPVFLPGKSHGQRGLVGYSPWGCNSCTWLSNSAHTQESEIKLGGHFLLWLYNYSKPKRVTFPNPKETIFSKTMISGWWEWLGLESVLPYSFDSEKSHISWAGIKACKKFLASTF